MDRHEAWDELVDFVEEHGGSLSQEGRSELYRRLQSYCYFIVEARDAD